MLTLGVSRRFAFAGLAHGRGRRDTCAKLIYESCGRRHLGGVSILSRIWILLVGVCGLLGREEARGRRVSRLWLYEREPGFAWHKSR